MDKWFDPNFRVSLGWGNRKARGRELREPRIVEVICFRALNRKAGLETRGRERVRSCGPGMDFGMSDFRADAFPVQ